MIQINQSYLSRSYVGSEANMRAAIRAIADQVRRDQRCKTFVYRDTGGRFYTSRYGKSSTLQIEVMRGRMKLHRVYVNEAYDAICSDLCGSHGVTA